MAGMLQTSGFRLQTLGFRNTLKRRRSWVRTRAAMGKLGMRFRPWPHWLISCVILYLAITVLEEEIMIGVTR